MDNQIDDEIEIELRSAPEAAARLLLVASLCRRAFIEASPRAAPDSDAAAEAFDLARWLADEGLLDSATLVEHRLLAAPTGSWTPAETAEVSWQGEALLALGWALGMVEPLPPADAPADAGPLLSQILEPWASTAAFRRDATLRAEIEIAHERERAELWHWRGEAAALLAAAPQRERREIEAAIRDVAAEAKGAGLLDTVIDDDFAVHGRPYAALTPDVADELGILAFERLRALDWLCGLSPSWDPIPSDD